MINLLSMGYSKLFRNLAFRISAAVMALLPITAALFTYFDGKTPKVPQDGIYNIGLYLMWLIIGSFVSVFVGQDYDEKTLNNKIMAGHSRTTIYFADYIVTLSGAVIMQLISIAAGSAVAVPLFGMYTEPPGTVVCSQLIVLCIMAVYTAIVLFITTVVTSKTYAQGVSMFVVLALFIVGNSVYDNVTKLKVKAAEENTAITKLVRENSAKDILYNALPQSQADRVLEGGIPDNAAKMVCIDISTTAVFTAAGLFVFSRKDIK